MHYYGCFRLSIFFLKNQRLSNIQVQYLRENGEKCCIGFKWNNALRKCIRKYSHMLYNVLTICLFYINIRYNDQNLFLYYLLTYFSLKLLTFYQRVMRDIMELTVAQNATFLGME